MSVVAIDNVVLSHPCAILVDMKEEVLNGQVVNRVRVVAPNWPIAEATMEQLKERIQSTICADNQTAAIRAEAERWKPWCKNMVSFHAAGPVQKWKPR